MSGREVLCCGRQRNSTQLRVLGLGWAAFRGENCRRILGSIEPTFVERLQNFFWWICFSVAEHRHCPYACCQIEDGDIYVQMQASVRGCEVFLVQPTSPPANANLMDLLIMIDDCRKFFVLGLQRCRDSSCGIEAKPEYYLLTSRGRKLVTILQAIVDDSSPLVILQMDNFILKGLADLFTEYVEIGERSISIDGNATTKDRLIVNLAPTLSQQLSVLTNLSTLALKFFPNIAKSIFQGHSHSDDERLNEYVECSPNRELKSWIITINEAAKHLRHYFCEQFVSQVLSPDNAGPILGAKFDANHVDQFVAVQDPMPSDAFQELFLQVRLLERFAQDICVGEDLVAEDLLREVMEAVFDWLQNDHEFWTVDIESSIPLLSASFSQFALDIESLLQVARVGDNDAENDGIASWGGDLLDRRYRMTATTPFVDWGGEGDGISVYLGFVHCEYAEAQRGPIFNVFWGNLRDVAMDSLEKYVVGIIDLTKIYDFYNDLHSYLASRGVDGVKVDVQNLIQTLGAAYGGRVSLTRQYPRALEDSMARNFNENNFFCCMNHNSDYIFSSKKNFVARASEDFMPGEPTLQTLHVASVSFNSLLLGEIVIPDRDMFHSNHVTTKFHGAARAKGGCGIYVSDKPGQHDLKILKKLVLPDGSVLRALNAGRSTRDFLFDDPVVDGQRLLKIWNMNKFSGVIGVFNCQGAGNWPCRDLHQEGLSTALKLSLLSCDVSPSNVEFLEDVTGDTWTGDCVVYAFKTGHLSKLPKNRFMGISLATRGCAVYTISPIRDYDQKLQFAPIGLIDMFNYGGAVKSLDSMTESTECKIKLGDGVMAVLEPTRA